MSEHRIRLHGDIDVGPITVPRDVEAAAVEREAATEEVARLLGDPPAIVLTTSCTHALEASATVLGIAAGDEVIVPAYTFPSTANGFLLRGATIRFADVDPDTINVTPETVKACMTERTRAVVVVHYAGVAADVAGITGVAAASDASVVEDAAHGVFASDHGVPLGRLGRLGCLSFHRTKNIATGEGGALVVNDPDLVDRAFVAVDKGTNRRQFERGEIPRYDWTGPGSGWRMADPLLPLLRAQLARAERTQARRLEVWREYRTELADWAAAVGARLPVVPDGAVHPAPIFHVLLPDAAASLDFVQHCAAAGIEAVAHYGSLPDTPFGREIGHPDDGCPVARDVAARLVRLPLHPGLTAADVRLVLQTVRGWRA
jgi:dTDP-4-amino-4,6-dideoxygalactose transaminase